MDIARDSYVEKLFAKSWNGKVKIITGIRRCGKSFLLSPTGAQPYHGERNL